MDAEITRLQEIAGRSEALAMAGGIFLVWWGLIMALNAFYYNLLSLGLFPPGAPESLGIFPMIIGCVGALLIARFRFKGRLFISWRTQAISIVWLFGAIAIMIYMTGSRLAGLGNALSAVAFMAIIFGLITAVMGATERRSWLLWPATGWMACGYATFFLDNDDLRSATFGLCALAFMVLPGLILTRQDKRTSA